MATENSDVFQIDSSTAVKSIRELKNAIESYKDVLLTTDKSQEKYTETLTNLTKAQHKLNEVNRASEQGLPNIKMILTNTTTVVEKLLSGISAAQGAITLFGGESNLLEQTLLKLQAAISLTQGLKGLVGFKNSLSELRASLKAAQIGVKAFNTSLLANPIVLIASAVIGLAAYFSDLGKELSVITGGFKDLWKGIIDLIPGINSISDAFDKITQAVAGVATAIVRLLTAPLNGLIKLLKGDLDGALEAIKAGFKVLENFNDGYTEKAISNAQKAEEKIQAEAAAATKRKIEENEAQYGSDWKYTQEGKKLYHEYYDTLLEMYEQDSEDHRKIYLEKLNYDRQYREKVSAQQAEAIKEARQMADERVKILQEEQAQVEQILKAITDYNLPEVEIKINDLTEEYNKQLALLQKHGEDTTELTRQYNEQVNNLRLEAQRQLNDQLYQERQKELKDISANNQLALKEVDIYIQGLQNRLLEKQFSLSAAIDSGNEEEIMAIFSQIEAITTQINEFENEQYNQNQQFLEEYQLTLQELINSEILTAEQRIDIQRELQTTNNQIELEKVNYQKTLIERQISEQQRQADVEGKILDIRKKKQEAYLSALSSIATSSSQIMGQETVQGKIFAIAAATIDTYKAAVSALASTPGGPIAKGLAFSAVLGTGLAAVKNIVSTKVPGTSDSTSSSAVVENIPVPDVEAYYEPEITPVTQQLTSTEKQNINTQRVIIVESDIEESLNLSRVRTVESSF